MWFFNKAPELVVPSNQGTVSNTDPDILLAVEKTNKRLRILGETFYDICLAVECSETKTELYEALIPFDEIMRIFRVAVPQQDHHKVIVNALIKLKCTARLAFHMESSSSIHDAIIAYKTSVANKLEETSKRMQQLRRSDTAFNSTLLSDTVHNFHNGLSPHRSPARKRRLQPASDREYYSQPKEAGLLPTIIEKLPRTEKRAKINVQLVALAKKHNAALSLQAGSDNLHPVSEKFPSRTRRACRNDGERTFKTKFTN